MVGKIISAKMIWSAAGAGLVLLGLLILTGLQLLSAQATLGEQRQTLTQCEADNEHQTKELAKLQELHDSTVAEIALEREEMHAALLDSQRRTAERERELARERRARAEIYDSDPDCAAWAEIEVCGPIADRIRQRRAELIDRWEEAP